MFLRNLLPRRLAPLILILLPLRTESKDLPATSVKIHPEVRFRVRTFARETLPISNPIRWAQFNYRVPEGSRVEEGEAIFKLDLTGTREAVKNLTNELEETRNQSATRLAQMREEINALEDRRAELQSSRDIQAARLSYLKSLPLEQDVEIVRGRLMVAERNLEAVREELRTARERLENDLVAPAVVEEAELDLRRQEARTEYARKRLASTRAPTHPDELALVELRIENLDLEIKKLDSEIDTQRTIVQIEQASQERRVEERKSRRDERLEELEHEFVYAPRGGVLLYSPQLKQELTKGGKLAKGVMLAEIPDPDSVALEGHIPEQMRHLFQVGDPARVELNIDPSRKLRATLISISPFSRDAREDEEESSGVKVVDVVLELETPPENLPLGVYGWATLRTADPREGPAVPVSWVRFRGGEPHVSVDGVYESVTGVVSGDLFQLSPPSPPLEEVEESGIWREPEDPQIRLNSDRFVAGGELSPLESVPVEAPSIRAWDIKVVWLHPENTFIEKGEPLVRLDSERIRNRAEDMRNDAKTRTEDRESAEEELAIKQRERDFQVASAENTLQIRKLEQRLVENGVASASLHQARLDAETARLELEGAKRELARALKHPEWTAPAVRERLKRDVRRKELRFERAEIELRQVLKGAGALERSAAKLEVVRQEAATAETKSRHYRTVSRARSHLRWRVRRERNRLERLKEAEKDLAAMEITAPASGLVKYEKIWDGVRQSKLKTGMRVWRGSRLLSLSDTEKVYVNIEVPERYVRHVKKGMTVQVRIPSEGNLQWDGTVAEFSEILEPAENAVVGDDLYGNRETPQEQALSVRIIVNSSPEDKLKPGAIAHIIFPFEK